ncbi:MAG TPA: prepilin-type N-terminal cleavage/methylation domain-containing protein [Candidatus Deferrimicrobiaceae bacterium]
MTRPILASNSNGGFTLIEVMVSLAIISIVVIALADTSIVSLDYNMNNLVREDAVLIADNVMDTARNTTFVNLASTATPLHIYRNIRGKAVDYSVTRAITPLDGNNTQVAVEVTWAARRFSGGRWVPTQKRHKITTVISAGTGSR